MLIALGANDQLHSHAQRRNPESALILRLRITTNVRRDLRYYDVCTAAIGVTDDRSYPASRPLGGEAAVQELMRKNDAKEPGNVAKLLYDAFF